MFHVRRHNFSISFANNWRISIYLPEDLAPDGLPLAERAVDLAYASREYSDVEVAVVRVGAKHVRDDAIFYGVDEKHLLRLMALAQSLPDKDIGEDDNFPITEEMLDFQYALRRVKTPM